MATCPDVSRNPKPVFLPNSSFDFGDGIVSYNYSPWFIAPMAVILSIVSIASVVGNGLVVATIARHRGMRTRTNLLLANLAAADILVGALDMPFSLVALIQGKWVFGEGACQFNAFTTGLALMASIHTLMFISIHKYISMTRPFSRAMTPLRISLMACSVWVWSCLYNLAPFVGITSNVYKLGATQCGPIVPCTPSQKIHSFVNTTMNFLLPLSVMSYCNFKISRAVGEHMGRMRQTSNISYRNSVMQQKHITITLVIVMVCFLICWTPYMIYSSTLAFVKDKSIVPLYLNPIVYWCGYANSACNPIIYAFRSPSFRQGYLEILCRSQPGTNVGSFRSGSSITHYNRNNSDRIHAPSYAKRNGKGAPWGQRFSKLQWDASSKKDTSLRHQLLPNSGVASRVVMQRMTRHSMAQEIKKAYPSKSTPDLHSVQGKIVPTNCRSQNKYQRRYDSDSCLAVLLAPPDQLSETRACSFHTLPDESVACSNQEIFKVIVTDTDGDRVKKTSTPCLRTASAYVISIDGDQSIQNGVQVIVTDADAQSNNSQMNVNSNASIARSTAGSASVRPPSLLPVATTNDRSILSLQDIKTYSMKKTSSGVSVNDKNRTRRHTEAVNSLINVPKHDTKFYSDPGGLAPKRLGSVERINSRRLKASSPANQPLLRNLAPKWRLSVEALDKNATNTAGSTKNTGIRGSIMALLGKGSQNI